jgi:predicted ATPase/DNA-binding winged helix-turn-helix (wHTH) protein
VENDGRRVVSVRSVLRRLSQNPLVTVPVLRFGPFELDIANVRLWRDGELLDLPPKSFELLAHLAQRPGELVLKDQLLDAVWGRRFVSEGAVKTVVSELRAALGDDPRAPRWIETVQRRGYRFVGTVSARAEPAAAADAPSPAGPVAPEPSAPPAPALSGSLPFGLPGLIGRDAELAALEALLDGHRLVTVAGVAGVGKTRLALAAAARRRARHPDGAWLLELAPLAASATDAATLRSSIARALQAGGPAPADDAALVRALRGRALLLVVDNAEHVIQPLAPLLALLHGQLPDLHLLVTSREPLQVPSEALLRLEPFGVPADDAPDATGSPALSFFASRVAARLPGFVPDGEQQRSMIRLCRALDGLPLAMELAAARVTVLGIHGLADHLLDAEDPRPRLRLLTQGARTAAPHQRTLRAALDWSHALLTPQERQLFRRLGVFRGGFTLESAQAVAAPEGVGDPALLDALDALVAKSMVDVAAPAGGPPRFGLLESLREYALEQLAAAGEEHAIARRHLAWAGQRWRQARVEALTRPLLEWTQALEPDIDNLRAALRWAEGAAADDPDVEREWIELVSASAHFWQRVGLPAEGGAWCRSVMVRADAHPDPMLRARMDFAVGTLCRFTHLGTPEGNLERARRAADTFARSGDAKDEYFCHFLAWSLAIEISESVDRSVHVPRMEALVQPDWNPLITRFLRHAQAFENRMQGRSGDQLAASRAELASFRAMGARAEAWTVGHQLMLIEHDAGHEADALALGASLLDDIRAAGRLRSHIQLLAMHTAMRAHAGDVAGARRALAEGLPALGSVLSAEQLLLALAWVAAHEGRADDAARVLAWFRSPQRGGGNYGPHTFTHRACEALAQRLRAKLGGDVLQRLTDASQDLGDAEAVRLGLRGA